MLSLTSRRVSSSTMSFASRRDPLTDRLCVASSDHWTQPTLTVRFFPFSAATPKSSVLKKRVEAVREMRLGSKKKATQRSADTPYLFQENHQPDCAYVGIPRVVSETRKFYTAAHLDPDVIAGDKVYVAVDPEGILFGLISSSMFITWQRAIGGRLESRLSFANTLTWNTFPVPELDEKTRQRIIKAGKKVLDARALHPERSLAEHYNPPCNVPGVG